MKSRGYSLVCATLGLLLACGGPGESPSRERSGAAVGSSNESRFTSLPAQEDAAQQLGTQAGLRTATSDHTGRHEWKPEDSAQEAVPLRVAGEPPPGEGVALKENKAARLNTLRMQREPPVVADKPASDGREKESGTPFSDEAVSASRDQVAEASQDESLFDSPTWAQMEEEASDLAATIVIAPSPPARIPPQTVVGQVPGMDSANTPARPPVPVMLPAGSVIEVRLTQSVSSKENHSGDEFEAVLDQNLAAGENVIVFKRGTRVRGRLIEVIPPGRISGRGSLSLQLEEIYAEGAAYPIKTNRITLEAESSKGKDLATVGAASAVGAVLGAIFGGKKGAVVGGASGAGASTAGVVLSRGRHVEIPAERLFSFRLEEGVEVRRES